MPLWKVSTTRQHLDRLDHLERFQHLGRLGHLDRLDRLTPPSPC
jgi:hypothetical protein